MSRLKYSLTDLSLDNILVDLPKLKAKNSGAIFITDFGCLSFGVTKGVKNFNLDEFHVYTPILEEIELVEEIVENDPIALFDDEENSNQIRDHLNDSILSDEEHYNTQNVNENISSSRNITLNNNIACNNVSIPNVINNNNHPASSPNHKNIPIVYTRQFQKWNSRCMLFSSGLIGPIHKRLSKWTWNLKEIECGVK